MKRKVSMITTIDNPFDPFVEFDKWFMFDNDLGYCSCSLLARIGKFSDSLTDFENDEEQERAIDRIIELDFMNIYKKVVKYIELEDYLKERNSSYESSAAAVKEE